MRSPEDGTPRDAVEPEQEATAVRYELAVRLAPPYRKRALVIRCYEDGEVKVAIGRPSLV